MPMPSIGFRRVLLAAGLSTIGAIPLTDTSTSTIGAIPLTDTSTVRESSLLADDEVKSEGGRIQDTNTRRCNASSLPVYVLNMDNRGAKLDVFAQRLPWPLKACRVTGVDGNKLPKSLDPKLIPTDSWQKAKARTNLHFPVVGTQLTKGAVGLALAHARAWARMLERGEEIALFAEDDLHFFVPNLIEQVEGACEIARLWKPEQILLQFCGGNTSLGTWPKPTACTSCAAPSAANYTDAQVMSTRSGARLDQATLEPVLLEACQGFYLLTAKGARIMLQKLFPIMLQIDAGIQSQSLLLDGFGDIETPTPFYGAARSPGLNTHGLFPPVAQCDERDGLSDTQQFPGYIHDNPDTESDDARHRPDPCGGIASLGTSANATLLLDYFLERVGTWDQPGADAVQSS